MRIQSSKSLRILIGAASLFAAAVAWYFLAPQSVGGRVAYTVVTGQSMEPTLRADDLAIVREAPSYGRGDAVAYRSSHLGQIVLHRIVEVEDGRFVLQGDNNDFLDADHPRSSDVIGRLWVRIPKAGFFVSYLRSPVGLAACGVAILSILGFFSTGERRRRRARRLRSDSDHGDTVEQLPISKPAYLPAIGRPPVRAVQVGAIAVLLCMAAYALFGYAAFTRSLFKRTERDIDYSHRAAFEYSAAAPEGPVYQAPKVRTGDPVFVRLVDQLDVAFDYSFETDATADVKAAGRMDAVLRSDNGWTRAIEIAAPTVSRDGQLRLSGRLDLDEIESVVRRVERMTGMAPGTYGVSLEPHIEVAGTIAGEDINESFEPALAFQLDDIQLGLVRPDHNGTKTPLADLLEPARDGSITSHELVAQPLVIGGREVSVVAARRSALTGLAIGVLLLVAFGIAWMRRRPVGELQRIQARYGSLLIRIEDVPDLGRETVDVPDFETLVRLAQQFEQPIMCLAQHEDHIYMLYFDGLLYRYRISGGTEPIELRVEGSVTPAPVVRAVLTRPMDPLWLETERQR